MNLAQFVKLVLDEWKKSPIRKQLLDLLPKDEGSGYPPPCPNCDQCFHYTEFGSDIRCPKCKKMHYWFGLGWLLVINGKTQFPDKNAVNIC